MDNKNSRLFKTTGLALAISLAMTGCGGGSDDSSGNNGGTETTTYKVQIKDGYLVDAEVYVDRNKNGVADANEKVTALTDEQGYITLPVEDKEFPIIARAIAGKTYDTDKGGRLTDTYELSTAAGMEVMNPFTLIAAKNDVTIEEIAQQLGVNNTELLTSDYVAAKTTKNDDASKVHFAARSFAELFAKGDASDISDWQNHITNIVAGIAEVEGYGSDDDLNNYIVREGVVVEALKPLKEALVGKTYDFISTNEAYGTQEGFMTLTFNDSTITVDDHVQGEDPSDMPTEYHYNGFMVSGEEGGPRLEEVIFLGDSLALTVTADNDLQVGSTQDLAGAADGYADFRINAPYTEEALKGKTLYHFWDDAGALDYTAKPYFSVLSLAENGSGTITEFASLESYLSNTPEATHDGFWTVIDGSLVIGESSDSLTKDQDWTFHFTDLSDHGLHVAYDYEEGTGRTKLPRLITENEDLAVSLFEEWTSLVHSR
ncbi:hypothetical protein LNL84_17115 [Vibrio sp. ZSDZ34]|uniref:Lipoprotein n=1 Tax=Vibrio gelatinilyticus TaxID=2893468 RepID=A0A9X1WCU3_9VIBR|nr:hypothetical protein [Vibrio gelatinilyticus]MCJ2378532.1 hypothetical protein [Vibrio gelatinilyticus]